METIVQQITKNLNVAHGRLKNYAKIKIPAKEYSVGEHVFLRVKQKRSSLRTRFCTKIAPRYVGPSEVLDKVGSVSYQLDLSPHIRTRDVFHVSLLRRYIVDKNHIIDSNNE